MPSRDAHTSVPARRQRARALPSFGEPPGPAMLLRGALRSERYRPTPPLGWQRRLFGCPGVSAEFAATSDPPACRSESSPDGGKNLHEAVGTAGPSAQKHPAAELALRKKQKDPSPISAAIKPEKIPNLFQDTHSAKIAPDELLGGGCREKKCPGMEPGLQGRPSPQEPQLRRPTPAFPP